MSRIEELEKELRQEKERIAQEIEKEKLRIKAKDYFNANFKFPYNDSFQENYYNVESQFMNECIEDEEDMKILLSEYEVTYYNLCQIDFEESRTEFESLNRYL